MAKEEVANLKAPLKDKESSARLVEGLYIIKCIRTIILLVRVLK